MATINSLSLELLEQILEHVVGDSNTDKGSLSSTSETFDTRPFPQSLLLVNRAFHAVAQRLHNRHIHLTIRSERGDKDTQRTLQLIYLASNCSLNADFLNSIRHLTITCEERKTPWRASNHPQPLEHALYPRYIEQLPAIIPKLSNLKSVTFRSELEISTQLLRALAKHHPQCHLHIRNCKHKPSVPDSEPSEISLENSPNLRSITVQLDSGRRTATDRLSMKKHTLQDIVLRSPHLESVDIKEGIFGDFPTFSSHPGRNQIEQVGASFQTRLPLSNNLKHLKSRGGNHVKLLEDVMDMRKLESLDIGYIKGFDFFSNRSEDTAFGSSRQIKFESLKHLSVEMGHSYDPDTAPPETYLQDFLAVCKPLESLKIVDRRGRVDLSVILDNHSHSLRKLHLHDSERKQADEKVDRYCLSLDEIQEIRNRCPKLKEFSVDMERVNNPESTKEILMELARFEDLEKLVFYFPLDLVELILSYRIRKGPEHRESSELASSDISAYPFNRRQSPSWLVNIFSFLHFRRIVNHLPPLKELRVNLGEWERGPMGLSTPWECVEAEHKRRYILTPRERDNAPNEMELTSMRLARTYEEISVIELREVRHLVDGENL